MGVAARRASADRICSGKWSTVRGICQVLGGSRLPGARSGRVCARGFATSRIRSRCRQRSNSPRSCKPEKSTANPTTIQSNALSENRDGPMPLSRFSASPEKKTYNAIGKPATKPPAIPAKSSLSPARLTGQPGRQSSARRRPSPTTQPWRRQVCPNCGAPANQSQRCKCRTGKTRRGRTG